GHDARHADRAATRFTAAGGAPRKTGTGKRSPIASAGPRSGGLDGPRRDSLWRGVDALGRGLVDADLPLGPAGGRDHDEGPVAPGGALGTEGDPRRGGPGAAGDAPAEVDARARQQGGAPADAVQ